MNEYDIVSMYDSSGERCIHRNTTFYLYITRKFVISNCRMMVVNLAKDHNWWLIPASSMNDDLVSDIGPYSELDECIISAIFLSD